MDWFYSALWTDLTPPLTETAFWQTIQNSTDPAMFEEYLRQFPTGIFAGLARIKRDGLQKDAAPEAAPETTAEAPIPAEPETSEEIETALLAPPLIPGTTGVGSIERFECSGPGAKTYVFRVVSVDGDTIRLDYTVDGEQRWVEKPIAYLGVNLFTRKERNDGNGIRYQRFDDDDFRGLAQLLPGSTFGGAVNERNDQGRRSWIYEIEVGAPRTIDSPLFGDIEVIPVLENRRVRHGIYYSEQTSFLTANGVRVGWTFKDREGTKVCNRVE